MVDILEGIIEILKSDTIIRENINDRIFGGKLPFEEIEKMPRKNIVIVQDGSPEYAQSSVTIKQRFSIWIYSETEYEGGVLDRLIFDCLKAVSRKTIVQMLIHSIGLGGVTKINDPDTGWPILIRTILVMADERKIN